MVSGCFKERNYYYTCMSRTIHVFAISNHLRVDSQGREEVIGQETRITGTGPVGVQ